MAVFWVAVALAGCGTVRFSMPLPFEVGGPPLKDLRTVFRAGAYHAVDVLWPVVCGHSTGPSQVCLLGTAVRI